MKLIKYVSHPIIAIIIGIALILSYITLNNEKNNADTLTFVASVIGGFIISCGIFIRNRYIEKFSIQVQTQIKSRQDDKFSRALELLKYDNDMLQKGGIELLKFLAVESEEYRLSCISILCDLNKWMHGLEDDILELNINPVESDNNTETIDILRSRQVIQAISYIIRESEINKNGIINIRNKHIPFLNLIDTKIAHRFGFNNSNMIASYLINCNLKGMNLQKTNLKFANLSICITLEILF